MVVEWYSFCSEATVLLSKSQRKINLTFNLSILPVSEDTSQCFPCDCDEVREEQTSRLDFLLKLLMR